MHASRYDECLASIAQAAQWYPGLSDLAVWSRIVAAFSPQRRPTL